jgi:hypothetical protein
MDSESKDGYRDSDERIVAQRPMGHTPGKLEDKETAAAAANRTGEKGTSALRPEGAMQGDAATEQSDGQHADAHRGSRHARGPQVPPDQAQPMLGTAADPLR